MMTSGVIRNASADEPPIVDSSCHDDPRTRVVSGSYSQFRTGLITKVAMPTYGAITNIKRECGARLAPA
jgi:hypothetical protein